MIYKIKIFSYLVFSIQQIRLVTRIPSRRLKMQERKRLGEIFIEQSILTSKSVDRVLAIAQRTGKRFAAVLEEMELITPEEFANAIATQFNLKTVFNFARYSFPP